MRKRVKEERCRFSVIFFCFLGAFVVVSLRLGYVQIFRNHFLTDLAERQYNVELQLPPKRGTIYDCKMVELASSVNVFSSYAQSKLITNKHSLAQQLSHILGRCQESMLGKLKKNKSFVWLKRHMSEEQTQAIRQLAHPHIHLLKESKRFYPSAILASHLIGFVNIDGRGLEGLELLYDEYMKGRAGRQFIQRDAKRRLLPSLEYKFEPTVDGHSLVLTIDQVIQYIAERELEQVCEKTKANSGVIIVMDPMTGRILAFANRPTYNSNTFFSSTQTQRKNRGITDCYEPGSTFKAITAAACLNEGIVTAAQKFFCENGEYRFRGRILHDHRGHGWLTFREVIEVSSNIGVCKATQRIGEKKFMEYIKAFGFGKKTGVDLPGEVAGIVRPLSSWSKIAITTIPMGQGIAVTPLQMACAFSVIANGGYLMKPYVVDRIINTQWELIKKCKPQKVRQVISEDTARTVREFLVNVVENGTGKRARIKGMKVGGKTGTAQKLEADGTYSHSKYIASFFGFVPEEKPALVIGVIVDEPKGMYYGGVVAAPVFQKVAEDTLKYLNLYKVEVQKQ